MKKKFSSIQAIYLFYQVGGVLGIRPEHYRRANGYSNSFWGWGGEDDDFYTRLSLAKLKVERPPLEIGHYRMMHHKIQKLNKFRGRLLKKSKEKQKVDGLSTVQYRVSKFELYTGFSYFLFDVGNFTVPTV
jgi:hypothetical protein